jgi:hypothetical protein
MEMVMDRRDEVSTDPVAREVGAEDLVSEVVWYADQTLSWVEIKIASG